MRNRRHCPNLAVMLGIFLAILVALLLAALLPDVSARPSSPVGACAGDLNGDRAVDDRDVATLLANFGLIEDPSPWTRGDLNDDGRIDAADLSILLKTYGCREWAPPEAAATLTGPPPDAIPEELEPWMPGGAEVSRWSGDEGDRFTTANTEGKEEARR